MGGIDVRVAQITSDRGLTFAQGPNYIDGADALDATVRAVSVDGSCPTDKLADAPRDPGGHSHRS